MVYVYVYVYVCERVGEDKSGRITLETANGKQVDEVGDDTRSMGTCSHLGRTVSVHNPLHNLLHLDNLLHLNNHLLENDPPLSLIVKVIRYYNGRGLALVALRHLVR
jgi:hypothetical protein